MGSAENAGKPARNSARHSRTIDYLRISVTDRCNLRCRYCMPREVPFVPHSEILRYEEFVLVAQAAAEKGIRHLKVTGGEPLIRRGCPDFVRMLKGIPGIETVTLTTNGVLLSEQLGTLKQAGIDGINVSLDTLNPGVFAQITGSDRLRHILRAIRQSAAAGIRTKVNVTVTEFTAPEEYAGLAALARDLPLDVRFIELMPIGYGTCHRAVANADVLLRLRKEYPGICPEASEKPEKYRHGFGPAVYYSVPGFRGSIGFISAVHSPFCAQCNRLRLTSTGFLKYCLCYRDGIDLRGLLRSGRPEREVSALLRESICRAVAGKPAGHAFSQKGAVTETKTMSGIGG